MKVRAELLVYMRGSPWSSAWDSRRQRGLPTLVTKAPVAVHQCWWYEGFAEVGGRF